MLMHQYLQAVLYSFTSSQCSDKSRLAKEYYMFIDRYGFVTFSSEEDVRKVTEMVSLQTVFVSIN